MPESRCGPMWVAGGATCTQLRIVKFPETLPPYLACSVTYAVAPFSVIAMYSGSMSWWAWHQAERAVSQHTPEEGLVMARGKGDARGHKHSAVRTLVLGSSNIGVTSCGGYV